MSGDWLYQHCQFAGIEIFHDVSSQDKTGESDFVVTL